MPKQDFTLQGVFGLGRDGPYLRAEEAIGIGLLVLILAILLIIGCWYYKRRNGYMMLQNQLMSDNAIRSSVVPSNHNQEATTLEPKALLNEYTDLNLTPDAPPAYEKNTPELLPPPYSP
uniref:Melanoma antigen recognized by T-cells 1 n=1 Tax=Callorhinchus milii TaxID=7868 RepID=A0A4W3I1E1_CALMI|eukprot:gi/632976314/ref/XP_007904726.1/ PREDICTED: melanoma antigen recognized by T-cells 1 isoform X1 [Callorhinchus milii]